MNPAIIRIGYLIAAALFIMGLKGLSHPRTAVRGNLLGAAGMLIAIVLTLLDRNIVRYEIIIAGLIVGSAIGVTLAVKIQITAMPQMVALLNGFGGAASAVVAGVAMITKTVVSGAPETQLQVATVASGIIGSVTFWGSLVAFSKLKGLFTERSVRIRGHQVVNVLLLVVSLAVGMRMFLPATALPSSSCCFS